MNAEHHQWMVYAEENLAVAKIALEHRYYNACLQNVQQAVEKYLKAVLLHRLETFPRTHSIKMLNARLNEVDVSLGLSEEECELLDTIYIPSKYPLGDALPDFRPQEDLAGQCVSIGERVRESISLLWE